MQSPKHIFQRFIHRKLLLQNNSCGRHLTTTTVLLCSFQHGCFPRCCIAKMQLVASRKPLKNRFYASQSQPTDTNNNKNKIPICWNCAASHQSMDANEKTTVYFFCVKCKCLQRPPPDCNYFRIFQLNPDDFHVDAAALSVKYRHLQGVLHPDRFVNRSDEEKRISEEFSALVNHAYNTLTTPMPRATYLLQLRGVLNAHDTVDNVVQENVENADFLLEIMTMNEEVDLAQNDIERLQQLRLGLDEKLASFTAKLTESFRENNNLQAKDILIRMRYYHSVNQRLDALLTEKGVFQK